MSRKHTSTTPAHQPRSRSNQTRARRKFLRFNMTIIRHCLSELDAAGFFAKQYWNPPTHPLIERVFAAPDDEPIALDHA